MNGTFDEGQPIFQQIAEMVEDDILSGTYDEEDQIISMAQFSSIFRVNPATVVKGIALLVNDNILYKKRGLGMFVATGAKKMIQSKRRERFSKELVTKLLDEAHKLDLTPEDVIDLIKKQQRS